MFDMEERARQIGFELAAPLTTDMIDCKQELRDLCSPKVCPEYATCWSCPPGAGPFEECAARIAGKSEGIIVQTMRKGIDLNDTPLLEEIEDIHHDRLDRFADEVRAVHEGALEFSTGGCDVCGTCTYPDEPCRQPDRQRYSLSAHGVDVVSMCERANMEYDFKHGTIRYIGLILY